MHNIYTSSAKQRMKASNVHDLLFLFPTYESARDYMSDSHLLFYMYNNNITYAHYQLASAGLFRFRAIYSSAVLVFYICISQPASSWLVVAHSTVTPNPRNLLVSRFVSSPPRCRQSSRPPDTAKFVFSPLFLLAIY